MEDFPSFIRDPTPTQNVSDSESEYVDDAGNTTSSEEKSNDDGDYAGLLHHMSQNQLNWLLVNLVQNVVPPGNVQDSAIF